MNRSAPNRVSEKPDFAASSAMNHKVSGALGSQPLIRSIPGWFQRTKPANLRVQNLIHCRWFGEIGRLSLAGCETYLIIQTT